MKIVILLLTFASLGFGQTSLPIETLRTLPWTGVMVCLPPGTTQTWCVPTVALLASSLILDTSRPTPVLHAAPAPAITERTVVVESPTGATVTVPDAGYIPASLRVHLNGLRQYSPGDFGVNGAVITFRKPFSPHDVVVVDYRL